MTAFTPSYFPRRYFAARYFGASEGSLLVLPVGVQNLAVFGGPSLLLGPVLVVPEGFINTSVFGTAGAFPGPVVVAPAGVLSGVSIGTPTVVHGPVLVVGDVPGDRAVVVSVERRTVSVAALQLRQKVPGGPPRIVQAPDTPRVVAPVRQDRTAVVVDN